MDKFGLIGKIPGVANPVMFEDFFLDGDDFVTQQITAEDYTETNATAGTALIDATGDNGVLLLDSASSTATQGVQIQRIAANFVPKAGRSIWFETRVKITDTATGPQMFLGLANIDSTIIASSLVTTTSHIGFSSITDDNALLGLSEKAGVAATGVNTTTLVNNTWATLGFIVNGLTDITFYVNGAAVSKITTVTAIPAVALAPSFVCQSGGAVDPIMHLDYWKCQQTR
jgi:hypothetical protein